MDNVDNQWVWAHKSWWSSLTFEVKLEFNNGWLHFIRKKVSNQIFNILQGLEAKWRTNNQKVDSSRDYSEVIYNLKSGKPEVWSNKLYPNMTIHLYPPPLKMIPMQSSMGTFPFLVIPYQRISYSTFGCFTFPISIPFLPTTLHAL